MKALIETSVLFPALVDAHPRHYKCKRALRIIQSNYDAVILNTHLAAELYTNLTRFPVARVHPETAATIIRSLRNSVEVVDLTMDDYLRAIDRCASKELISGVIYDALHFEAALKARAERLFTSNIRDFERLLDEDTPLEISDIEDLL